MPVIPLLLVVFAVANIEAGEACTRKLDLALMLDGSSSVCGVGVATCPRWIAILEFCKNIVNSLKIGFDETRVAFVTFSDGTNVEWNLLGYTNKTSLKEAIGDVVCPGGEFTDIVSVSKIITAIFDPLFGDRVGVQNIAILITDGAPKYIDLVYDVLSAAVQADLVGMFVVCDTTGCTDRHARGMASLPKTVNETYFMIDDYLKIDQVRDPLVKKFCPYQLLLNKVVNTVIKV